MNIDIDRNTGKVVLKNDYGGLVSANIEDVTNTIVQVKSNILPRGCIFDTTVGDYRLTFVEVPPGKFPIKWNRGGDWIYDEETGEERFENGTTEFVIVSMPWQYFEFSTYHGGFNDFRLFWTKEKVKSLDDELYRPQLPNIDEDDGYICMATAAPPHDGLITADVIEDYVTSFYETAFNSDMGDIDEMLPMDRWEWESISKTNPLCWQDFSLRFATTIQQIITDYDQGYSNDIFSTIERQISSQGEHLGIIELVS